MMKTIRFSLAASSTFFFFLSFSRRFFAGKILLSLEISAFFSGFSEKRGRDLGGGEINVEIALLGVNFFLFDMSRRENI